MLKKSLTEKSSPENFSADSADSRPNWLADRRLELGLTQEQLAESLGVTDRSILNWERGHHEPKLSIRQIKALCEVLKVELSDIPSEFPFYDPPKVKRRYNRRS